MVSAQLAPATQRQSTTRADFLRNLANALLACDLFETRILTGTRLYVFAVIEHASRRIRILAVTAHPAADWIIHLGRNLLMNLEDVGSKASFLTRDRDSQFTTTFDALLAGTGLRVVTIDIPDAPHERHHEAWDTNLQTRAPGPYVDLKPAPPPAHAARVRVLL